MMRRISLVQTPPGQFYVNKPPRVFRGENSFLIFICSFLSTFIVNIVKHYLRYLGLKFHGSTPTFHRMPGILVPKMPHFYRAPLGYRKIKNYFLSIFHEIRLQIIAYMQSRETNLSNDTHKNPIGQFLAKQWLK